MTAPGVDRMAPSARPPKHEAEIVATYVVLFFGVLPLVLWTLGGRLDLLFRLPIPSTRLFRVAGWALAMIGSVWMGWAMLLLRTVGRGWPISHLPPTSLVGRGPFLRTRHPVYLGFVTAFCGLGLASGSWGRAIGAGLLLMVGSLLYAVGFEEPRLSRRFGSAYDLYRQSTPILPIPLESLLRAVVRRWWLAIRPTIERVANRTILTRIGGSVWVTYGVFATLAGGIIAFGIAAALSEAQVTARDIDVAVIAVAIAVPMGSRLMWLGGCWRAVKHAPLPTLRRVGFVSWGGYLAFFGGMILTALAEGIAPLRLIDRTVIFALAGHGIGRIGCLTHGCCFGRESVLGLRWWNPDAKVCREIGLSPAAPRVPTQLLSVLHSFGVAVLAVGILWWGTPSGTATGVVLVTYALGRAAIECLRADPRHTPWKLTAGQIGAATTLIVGLIVLLVIPTQSVAPAGTLGLDFANASSHWPAIVIAMMLLFGVYGFHWKEVGSW